jgi:hypothetical protein
MTIDDRPVRALNLMKEALRLLDDAKAAADIGAHLDLAIHRLRESLNFTVHGSSKDSAA